MAIIRISHQKDYTCIANQSIRDKALSFKARGIHHLLLSYPDGWQINTDHLIHESDHDGRTAILSGLKELEESGYITRRKARDVRGRWIHESVVSELPQRRNTTSGKPDSGFSRVEKSRVGKPDPGEPDFILNTDPVSTDPSSTERKNTDLLSTHSQDARAREEVSEGDESGFVNFSGAEEEAQRQTAPRQPELHSPPPNVPPPPPAPPKGFGALADRRLNNLEKAPREWWGRWRVGSGPNQWHEGFVDWLTHNLIQGKTHTRPAVIGFLVNCEADRTGAALQKLDSYFDAYEKSWESQTGHSADEKWLAMAAKLYDNKKQLELEKKHAA